MCYYIYGDTMKEVKGTLKTMYILVAVWLLAVLFSAVMFTLSLIYEVILSIIISGVTGVLSCIGIFYTAYLIIKIKEALNSIENNQII